MWPNIHYHNPQRQRLDANNAPTRQTTPGTHRTTPQNPQHRLQLLDTIAFPLFASGKNLLMVQARKTKQVRPTNAPGPGLCEFNRMHQCISELPQAGQVLELEVMVED